MFGERNNFLRRSECVTKTSVTMATRRTKNSRDCGFGINSNRDAGFFHAFLFLSQNSVSTNDALVPYRGSLRSGRTACSACPPESRSASSPPTEPPGSHLPGTTACPSDGSSMFPGTGGKHRRSVMSSRRQTGRRKNSRQLCSTVQVNISVLSAATTWSRRPESR